MTSILCEPPPKARKPKVSKPLRKILITPAKMTKANCLRKFLLANPCLKGKVLVKTAKSLRLNAVKGYNGTSFITVYYPENQVAEIMTEMADILKVHPLMKFCLIKYNADFKSI